MAGFPGGMGRHQQHIVAIRPMHQPPYAVTEGRLCFMGMAGGVLGAWRVAAGLALRGLSVVAAGLLNRRGSRDAECLAQPLAATNTGVVRSSSASFYSSLLGLPLPAVRIRCAACRKQG
jgi:hypothetical protein